MGWSYTITDASRHVELGFVHSDSMPRVANVPPLAVITGAAHDDARLPDGTSGCNEVVMIGTHAGSHVDGLAHVSANGLLRGGVRVEDAQSRRGVSHLDMATVRPFVGPGLLVDLAARRRAELVEEDVAISVDHFEELPAEALRDAIVLIRTGWGALWRSDPRRYASLDERRPGLSAEAAAWLADKGVIAVGTDSFTLDVSRPQRLAPPSMPAHIELLMNRGVHIFEALDLEELGSLGVQQFLFAALPLRLTGATGSPVRPIAIV